MVNIENPEQNKAEQAEDEKVEDSNLELKKYFQKHLKLNEEELASIQILEMKKLLDSYFHQLALFADARLESVRVAVIPDKLWQKGSQVSESSARNSLISINEKYFSNKENPDEFGWFTHELGHCQKYFDAPDKYEHQSEEPAFPEMQDKSTYPNNRVELHAFSKQFEYLKGKGKAREEVWQHLQQEYPQQDWEFLQKVLDRVYQ